MSENNNTEINRIASKEYNEKEVVQVENAPLLNDQEAETQMNMEEFEYHVQGDRVEFEDCEMARVFLRVLNCKDMNYTQSVHRIWTLYPDGENQAWLITKENPVEYNGKAGCFDIVTNSWKAKNGVVKAMNEYAEKLEIDNETSNNETSNKSESQ